MDRLRIELDAIEAGRKSGRFNVGKRRRRSEMETARYAFALAQELAENGLVRTVVEHRVADKLGVSDVYVRRMLKLGRMMSEGGEIAPRNRPVQADVLATKPESGIGVQPAGISGEIGA